ncbi:hypothetical protein GCM10027443_11070 [Pontibacter brevis]
MTVNLVEEAVITLAGLSFIVTSFSLKVLLKPVPVIVTMLPVGPVSGDIDETVKEEEGASALSQDMNATVEKRSRYNLFM